MYVMIMPSSINHTECVFTNQYGQYSDWSLIRLFGVDVKLCFL